MSDTLKLALGTIFVDTVGAKVIMVHAFGEDETEHHLGFRFRGDNGINYREDGSVVGTMGDLPVEQKNAHDIVCTFMEPAPESPYAVVEIGGYYLNGLDQICKIVGTVPESSRFYADGYRFADQDGSYYRPDGFTRGGFFSQLNFVGQVNPDELAPELLAKLEMKAAKTAERQGIYETFSQNCTDTVNWVKNNAVWLGFGALLGVGVAHRRA
jgi:hypothetical protein